MINQQAERRLHMGCGESLWGRLPLRRLTHSGDSRDVDTTLKPAVRRPAQGKHVNDGHE